MDNTDTLQLIYSNPYDTVRQICHNVKTNDNGLDLPSAIAAQAAGALPAKTLLIPVPGHTGTCTYTLDIAIRIKNRKDWRDVRILPALRGEPRESLCEMKRRGLPTDGTDISFSIDDKETDAHAIKSLAATWDFVLVDNVIDTGQTARAAQQALGVPCKLITIGSTGRSGLPLPMLYYEIIRTSNQDSDPALFDTIHSLVDESKAEKALRHLTDWDYGHESLDAARTYDSVRATPTDPRERHDKVILQQGSYYLCQANDHIYQAYYLVRALPREDLLPEGAVEKYIKTEISKIIDY